MASAVKQLRLVVGDTQQQFAHRLGVSVTSVARYETNSPPSQEILKRLAGVAREFKLPLLLAVFEERIGPEPYYDQERYLNVRQLLDIAVRARPSLPPSKTRQMTLAVACLLLPDSEVSAAESNLRKALLRAEEYVEQLWGTALKNADPKVEELYAKFLGSPSDSTASAYIRALRSSDRTGASEKLRHILEELERMLDLPEAKRLPPEYWTHAIPDFRFGVAASQADERLVESQASGMVSKEIYRFLKDTRGDLPNLPDPTEIDGSGDSDRVHDGQEKSESNNPTKVPD